MKNLSNVIWGFCFVVVGVIIGLNAFEITNIELFFNGWWTLFIIIPCFVGLFREEGKTGNAIGFVIGVLLFLACQNILDFDVVWKLFLPIVLVVIGLSFIFKNTIGNSVNNKIKELNEKNNNKDKQEYYATFSGQKLDFSKEEFKGCSASAVFGGMNIDLRDALIKEDVVINVSAIFGGVDIQVDKNVNVKVNSTSIFGGVDNKIKNHDQNEVTIYINATCLFGGVEIK